MIKRRGLTVLAGAALAMPFIRPARAAVRLRFAIAHSTHDQFGIAARTFAEAVRAGSDGRLQVEVFTDGSMGSEESTLAGVQAGTLDLAMFASGLLGGQAPEIGLLDMPFLFRDTAHARAVLDGPIGAEYAGLAAAKGVPVLAWAENGVRHMTANRPIRSAADLSGLKLRIMPAPLLLSAFRTMGAEASVLSFQLVYEALRIGQFDAQENPVSTIMSARYYEVQSHLILTGHTYSAACIVASSDLLEDLSPPDRQLFAAAAKAATAGSRDFNDRAFRPSLDWLRDHGMTVIADPDRASFQRAAAPAEAAAALQFGADRIARIRSVA